jgi:hypothetical protein
MGVSGAMFGYNQVYAYLKKNGYSDKDAHSYAMLAALGGGVTGAVFPQATAAGMLAYQALDAIMSMDKTGLRESNAIAARHQAAARNMGGGSSRDYFRQLAREREERDAARASIGKLMPIDTKAGGFETTAQGWTGSSRYGEMASIASDIESGLNLGGGPAAAADAAMSAFVMAITTQGQRAIEEARRIRTELANALTFTASPSISVGGATPAAGGGSTPGRAGGGPVSAGRLYKVGESGAELFSPASNGRVYPMGKPSAGGGGGSVSNSLSFNITVNAGGGDAAGAVAGQVRAAIEREAREALRQVYADYGVEAV